MSHPSPEDADEMETTWRSVHEKLIALGAMSHSLTTLQYVISTVLLELSRGDRKTAEELNRVMVERVSRTIGRIDSPRDFPGHGAPVTTH